MKYEQNWTTAALLAWLTVSLGGDHGDSIIVIISCPLLSLGGDTGDCLCAGMLMGPPDTAPAAPCSP